MRIVHTSDWHAGRHWRGIDRLGELAATLDHLAGFVARERIDLVLVSGDVFDTGAPVADAERVVFEFLKRVGRGGVETIVIAGNHDSPSRLEAWGTLAELVGVHVAGTPRPADRGGVVEIRRNGETAVVALVPFAPTKGLVSALQLADDETRARQRYADGLRQIIAALAGSFRPDAVNLLMAHTHLEGVLIGGSERTVHLGEQWAATAQAIPSTAHYVALGHIHRPQRIEAAPAPTHYAGSPLQLDFGEAGQAKSFVVVEATAGAPARTTLVPYDGGVALSTVRATLAELERRADELARAGWLRVTVPLDAPDPNVNGKLHRLLPNAVVVAVELPERPDAPAPAATRELSPRERYAAYHLQEHGGPAGDELLAVFDELHADATQATEEA